MTALGPLLRPLRSARSISRKAVKTVRRRWGERRFRSIRRGRCNRCWCGGELLAFEWHASFGRCADCGTYVNRRPALPEELARLYSFDLYWHTRQRMKGHPSIEGRQANDLTDGRVKSWLDLIARFGPAAGRVVEVGCAHGVLLTQLRDRGYATVGVEPDAATARWVTQTTGLDVRSGLFPNVELPTCDLFLAFDVIEHVPDPLAFVRRAAELLAPGGVAILQTPIDRYELRPPFGDRFACAFDDLEHLHLLTDRAMQELARRCGLAVISATERLWLHHELCVFRKPL